MRRINLDLCDIESVCLPEKFEKDELFVTFNQVEWNSVYSQIIMKYFLDKGLSVWVVLNKCIVSRA